MERPGAAKGDQREIARILALLDRDDTYRAHHVDVDDFDDAGRRDKWAAHQTLYTVLTTLCKLFAPVIPFLSEAMYQNLRTAGDPESVHLCEFPEPNPSLVDNMPISVLEALASGVPVVSTHVGGVPHLVKHGETALLVPPNDPAAMADSIIRLLENPVLAAHLVANGLVHVKSFSWPAVRDRLLAAYAEATNARAAQAG